MINTKHYKSLTDIHFFKGHESVSLKTFDIKNLKFLEKYLYDNFGIKISIKKLNKNKKNKKNLIFSKDVEDKINKDFFIFF